MALLRRVIGAVLRRVRQHQGRTLRQVAEAAGVSLPYLSEVERGTKEASSEVLAAICRALGLPMPDLLDEVRKELLRDVPAPRLAARQGPRFATPVNPAAGRPVARASATGGEPAVHLHLGCVTQRSGDTGSGSTPTVRTGLRGAPRSASRLRPGCRSASRMAVGRAPLLTR